MAGSTLINFFFLVYVDYRSESFYDWETKDEGQYDACYEA